LAVIEPTAEAGVVSPPADGVCEAGVCSDDGAIADLFETKFQPKTANPKTPTIATNVIKER